MIIGLSFNDYFNLCKADMIATNDPEFRHQLGELRDHSLVAVRHSRGTEYYTIPHPPEVINEHMLGIAPEEATGSSSASAVDTSTTEEKTSSSFDATGTSGSGSNDLNSSTVSEGDALNDSGVAATPEAHMLFHTGSPGARAFFS
jgi:hypothetical protein